MVDPTRGTDLGDDPADAAGVGSGRSPAPGTPLWVKVFGVVALIGILLVLLLLLLGGEHGPGLHSSYDAGVMECACHEADHYRAGMRGRITVS
jgi:hypothetical protein